MQASIVKLNEPRPRTSATVVPAALAGGVAGYASRYAMPTKTEFKNLFNKENADVFVSSAAAAARAEKRSIGKFVGIGAIVTSVVALIANALKAPKAVAQNSQYSKMGILLDAPDCAYEIYCYQDKDEEN